MASLKTLAESKTPGVQKQTTFKIDPRIIRIRKGFNARPIDPEHVEQMKIAKRAGAILPPIFVEVDGDEIYVVDGHHRLMADLEMIAEGEDIVSIDAVQFKGSDADKVMHMVTSAQGKPLTPLQLGQQYRKMVRSFGWNEQQVANRAGKSVRHVQDMIALAEANTDVHKLVDSGKVAAHVALKAVKKHGSKAGAVIKEKLAEVERTGKTKVTNKAMREPKRVYSYELAGEVAADGSVKLDKPLPAGTAVFIRFE